MGTKIEIKEENPVSEDVASQSETEFFTKNGAMNVTVFLDNNCDAAIQTEFGSHKEGQCFTKQIKLEAATFSNSCEEQTMVSGREFLPADLVMVEIKEESRWPETKTSSVRHDVKDGDFTPVKSPRLATEAVSGDNSGDTPFPSDEISGKYTVIQKAKDSHECEFQKNDVTEIPSVEEYVLPEDSGKCNKEEDNYSGTLYVTGERPHKCNNCDRSFTQMSHLKMHSLIHEDKRTHQCNFCDRSFTHLSHLKMHSLIHEGEKPYKCEICGKSFSQLSYLKMHTLYHEDKKPYKCEICDERFTHLSSWKFHKLIHECKKLIRCEICEKSFNSVDFKEHILIHEGKQPRKCATCDKRYVQLSSLERHSLICRGNMPHKCEVCEKRFNSISHLKRHNLSHESIKPYKCETCDKSFTRLSHLKTHNLSHEGIKPHKCQFCDKGFTALSNLKRHILIHQRNKAVQV